MAFAGAEPVTVQAGTFDAWHFLIGDNIPGNALEGDSRDVPGKHPPYGLGCTADGRFVVLKAQVTGYMQTHYELVRLDD